MKFTDGELKLAEEQIRRELYKPDLAVIDLAIHLKAQLNAQESELTSLRERVEKNDGFWIDGIVEIEGVINKHWVNDGRAHQAVQVQEIHKEVRVIVERLLTARKESSGNPC